MTSGLITSWQIDGETVEMVADFIFLGSRIIADGDCSLEIKTCLLLGRKVMTNLDSILKSRDTTLPTKFHLVKTMVFPVVMYGCESWTVKKAECQRIDAFERWCWRRLLRVPGTARRSNQSILKEISPGCSLEGLMLKLKLQYFGHLTRRFDSLEKTLMLGGIVGRRRRGRQRMRWLDGHEFESTPGVGDGLGGLACCDSWGCKELDTIERLNWTEKKVKVKWTICIQLLATPWTVAYLAPPSTGFSRQEYWSGVPFPSPEDLPKPGIEPGSPHCRQTLPHLSHQGSPKLKMPQKKFLELIKECSKVREYKISTEKPAEFLYTSNRLWQRN